jgi:transposase InsO family protein
VRKEDVRMTWKETCLMDEKIKFIAMAKSGIYSFVSVCRQFDISRKTGYELLARYEAGGERALVPRSRAPHSHPNAIDDALARKLLHIKTTYTRFGPRKVRDFLVMTGHRGVLPASSTIGELFKRHNLVRPRGKRRARSAPSSEPLRHATAPNVVWSADFKGQFRLRNGRWCYPLTLSDNASRYLLVCEGLAHPSEAAVWPHFERAFREYGLPLALRTDNGSPFASVALGGLTRLSVWLLKLGIALERIAPGRPDQNGRHERMHRTLKDHLEPVQRNLAAQQRSLDWFQQHYNEQRPHDALAGVAPAMRHRLSPRAYPQRVSTPEYDSSIEVRRVRSNGYIKWHGKFVYVSEALVGEPIGLKPIDDARWQVLFCKMPLGVINERMNTIERLG